MEQYLKKFLESLTREDNSQLMENVFKGYACIFEGYADVRDIETVDATTQFSRKAAYNASIEGNNILSFLQRSGEELATRYTVDMEPELDNIPTSRIAGPTYIPSDDLDDQIDASDYNSDSQSFENNLGLTVRDMKDLQF